MPMKCWSSAASIKVVRGRPPVGEGDREPFRADSHRVTHTSGVQTPGDQVERFERGLLGRDVSLDGHSLRRRALIALSSPSGQHSRHVGQLHHYSDSHTPSMLLAPLLGRDILRRLTRGDVLGAREAAKGYLTPVR